MVGDSLSTGRQRYTTLAAVGWVIALLCAIPVRAQERPVERHGFSGPEGRLLAFYSASMAFSPAGLTSAGRLSFGVEVSYVPYLDEAQRRPSIDKPEATNLAPLFPRPRVGVRLRGLHLEGSWVPPLRLFDVEANLVGASVSGIAWQGNGWAMAPRLWVTAGRVRGAITCAASAMLDKGPDLATYYAAVCHGRESDDWFEPRMLGAELLASRLLRDGAILAYAGAGGRLDRSRFDIGVLRSDGSRDPDHPVLELRATRPHLTAGATWKPRSPIAVGGELFWAPGSLLTARATMRWNAAP
jgi:hypothetical protein